MAVLITGGAGYIGSHMALALRDAGEACVVLDDLSTGEHAAVPEGVPVVVGDVGDAALVLRVLAEYEIDTVAHFAARISAPESVRDPLGYFAANTGKTRDLLAAVVAAKVGRFIFSSTAAVYGLNPPTPTAETAACAPGSPYGVSKLMSEWIVRETAAAHDLACVTLRYFNVAGADPKGRNGQRAAGASNLITVATRAALGLNSGLSIFGADLPTPDGTGVRDYIHVSDLADAHVAALAYLRGGGKSLTLNCGYGWGYSVKEVVAAVRRAAGDFPVREAAARPGDPYVSIADASLIRETFGWRPRHADLDQIVGDALRWEKSLWRTGRRTTAAARPAAMRRRAS